MEFSTSEQRIVPLPGSKDVLTDILRRGAQQLLAQAIEAEVSDWLEQRSECRDQRGRLQVVRMSQGLILRRRGIVPIAAGLGSGNLALGQFRAGGLAA